MKSRGVVLFAHNNELINYVRQAVFCAKQITMHLKLPVTLVSSTVDDISIEDHAVFDKIITVEKQSTRNNKTYRDARNKRVQGSWYNGDRSSVYDLTPYEETIVMDTDYIINNAQLLDCFNIDCSLQIWKGGTYINSMAKFWRIANVSDPSIEMYWATVFYFKKNERTRRFFNLVKHIKDNWTYYRYVYHIQPTNFRNDFAFSIAIHIMNGFSSEAEWPQPLPGELYYSFDRDQLLDFKDNKFTVLLVDPKRQKNTVTTLPGESLHVMNKISLEKYLDGIE
jgi:hypothetical protein